MENQLKKVKAASLRLAHLSSEQKNQALKSLGNELEMQKDKIIQANQKDLNSQKNKLPEALYSRLILDTKKLHTLSLGLSDVMAMEDPIGKISFTRELSPGLQLQRISTPIGVIAIIFESRPDVAVQIASLLLKTGNAGILKGGKEAQFTLDALSEVFKSVSDRFEFLPEAWISFVSTRDEVSELLQFKNDIDLVIPRGSNQLVQSVMSQTQIPVLGHADGICHIYWHRDFPLQEGLKIVADSKLQSPSACNALETLLVHRDIYDEVKEALTQAHPELYLHESPGNWHTEYGGPEVSIKAVSSASEAIDHINQHGSKHTDAILATDKDLSSQFQSEVDSGNVFVNCSTRFSDGFRYGFGAEVGISTSKIHARGPVGTEGLTSYKYYLNGKNHLVSEFKG